MVPSWTETLLRAGIPVVGRTRFCIHPADQVKNIPIVGGTKEVNWDIVQDLKPDLVLMDWMLPDGQGIDFFQDLKLS